MSLEQFRDQKVTASERVYVLLLSLFISLLLLTNVITSKYIQLGPFTFTAGSWTYPFTFLFIDLITELYGKNRAKLTIWLGLLASILMTGLIYAAHHVSTYTYSLVSQKSFAVVFGFTPGIVLGSMVAYVIAQQVDVYLFDWLRRLTSSRYLWLRNNVATLVGQLFDTAIFAAIAWVFYPLVDIQHIIEPITWETWYQITRNEYMLKVIFTFINIPLVYVGVYWVKRYIKGHSNDLHIK